MSALVFQNTNRPLWDRTTASQEHEQLCLISLCWIGVRKQLAVVSIYLFFKILFSINKNVGVHINTIFKFKNE